MKTRISLLIVVFLMAAALSAETISFSSLVPKTAKSMAMGGVFSSVPTGEFSFFGNPASFASGKGMLILPSIDAWAYMRPTASNISNLINKRDDSSAFIGQVFNLMEQNGGVGGGASAGMGFKVKGLGVGLFATSDEFIDGASPASGVLHSETEVTGVIGLGLPIKLGDIGINIGGDLRPFYRVSLQPMALTDLIPQNGSSAIPYADAFFGAAVDLGASIQLGSVTIGLSVRDIAPTYSVSNDTLDNVLGSSGSGTATTTGRTDTAVFTPDLTAGLSWSPKLAPGLVDPSLYVELQKPVYVIQNWDGIGSALNLIHIGAEVRLLSFIYLRGGINRGWLSAGAGIKLLFLDVNAAVFTEELGALPGDKPRSGLALQAALRF